MVNEHKPQYGLTQTYRAYQCKNCGHVQAIKTNHTDDCIDYCKECSVKPSFGNSEYRIPFNDRTYRPFTYYGEIE